MCFEGIKFRYIDTTNIQVLLKIRFYVFIVSSQCLHIEFSIILRIINSFQHSDIANEKDEGHNAIGNESQMPTALIPLSFTPS